MATLIGTLLIIILVGAMGYAGYRDGAYAAIYSLVRNAIAFLVAMTFFEPLAAFLARTAGEAYPRPLYYKVIAFAFLFGVVIVLGRWLRIRYTVPEVRGYAVVDKSVGPVAGVLNGLLVAGVIFIIWSMMPFAKYLPNDGGRIDTERLVVDSGSGMLRFYDFARRRMRGGRTFLLHDEPLKKDINKNGVFDPGEDTYLDLNNNGQWDRGWLWRYKTHADIHVEDLEAAKAAGPQGE